MATTAYYAWDRDGRPITPARPIREFVEKMKLAYPAAAHLFSWYADDNHYQADYPQDHTPYSRTPWPVTPNPYPYVFATDIMHRPDLGVDCNILFPYWLAEAKAGRTPWVKYLIWQARIYHVRNNWTPNAASNHYDHVHQSTRTDHRDTTMGGWSPTPEDDVDAEAKQWIKDLHFLFFDLDSAPRPVDSEAGKIEEIRARVRALSAGAGLPDHSHVPGGVAPTPADTPE